VASIKCMPVPREKLCRIAHITMDIFDRDVLARAGSGAALH